MATAHVTLDLRVRDLATVKLLFLRLQFLADQMRVGASPFAEELEKILERWESPTNDETDEAA